MEIAVVVAVAAVAGSVVAHSVGLVVHSVP